MQSYSLLIFSLLFGCCFAACTTDHVEVTHPTQVDQRLIQEIIDPSAVFDAAAFASQFSKAANASAQEALVDNDLAKTKKTVNWSSLWRSLDKELSKDDASHVFASAPRVQEKLFAFSARECSEASFSAFAGFAAKYDAGRDFLVAPKRSCPSALSPALTIGVIEAWVAERRTQESKQPEKARELARKYVALLAAESTAAGAASLEWKSAVTRIDLSEWNRELRALLEGGDAGIAVELIKAHRAIGAFPGFGDLAVEHLAKMEGKQAARLRMALVATFGSRWLVDLISSSRPSVLRKLSIEESLRLLALLNDLYLKDTAPLSLSPLQKIEAAWDALLETRDAARSLKRLSREPELDAWLRELHGKFDALLLSFLNNQQEMAVETFFRQLASDRIDAIWFKTRWQKKFSPALGVSIADVATEGALDELLSARVRARLSGTIESVEEYCRALESFGHAAQSVSREGIVAIAKEAGCFVVEGADSISIKTRKFSLSDDTVLRTRGASLRIEASEIDAGLIDASASQVPRSAKLGPYDKTPRDAVTFPLPVGIKIATGEFWFVMHLPYQTPQDGGSPKAHAKQGPNGGNVELIVTDGALSFSPSVISAGGPGETALPPIKGGAGDKSEFIFKELQGWLSARQSIAGVTNYTLMTVPTIFQLRKLMTESGWVEGRAQLVWSEKYLFDVPAEQRRKIESVCAGYDSIHMDGCFRERVIPRAISVLQSEVAKNPSPYELYDLSRFIPQIQSTLEPTVLVTESGKNGPENKNGASGQPGAITLKGFEP